MVIAELSLERHLWTRPLEDECSQSRKKLGSVTAAANRTMVEVTVGEIGDKTEPLVPICSGGLQRSVPIRTSARCWPMLDRCGGDTRVTHAGAASPLRIEPPCSGLGFTGELPERKEQVS
jgi:hypothetical protein